MSLRITTITENTAGPGNLHGEWGLSFLIEQDGFTLLMDSGASTTAVHNADRLRIEVRTGSTPDEIIKFAGEMPGGLVAMSTHGRSGLGRWAYGSIADKVLHGADTPVLLVRCPGACQI